MSDKDKQRTLAVENFIKEHPQECDCHRCEGGQAMYESGFDDGWKARQPEVDRIEQEHRDLAMFVRCFLGSKFVQNCSLKERAAEYLQRKGLQGSLLRTPVALDTEEKI